MTLEKAVTCSLDTETGAFITSHQTPSVQGGVVKEPL
jgi:hypothetical protein